MKNTGGWSKHITLVLGVSFFIVGPLIGGDGRMNSAIAAPPPFPAPTDLSGVTQNWDKNLPSASRFTVLANFGGAAVRDNNTGLVREQSPTITTMDWLSARGLNA